MSCGYSTSHSRILRAFHKAKNGLGKLLRGRPDEANTQEDSQMSRVSEFEYPFDIRLVTAKMPWYASLILQRSALNVIVDTRRRNYELMQERIREIDDLIVVYPELGESVCPWAFPVLIDDRSAHDLELQRMGIPLFSFGETLHSALFEATSTSQDAIDIARYLSSRLLCFSIHQGISIEQQQAYADRIAEYFLRNR